jgi:hypothetical protein
MIQPVLLAYTKPIKDRQAGTRFEVSANALLQLDDDTVSRFNIPIAHEFSNLLIERDVSSYSYERWHGQTVQVPPCRRLNPGTGSTYNNARIRKYRRSGWWERIYEDKSYAIRFPYFFNAWMIQKAVTSMVGTEEENLELSLDNGRRIYQPGAKSEYRDSRWGTAKVVQFPASTRNLDKVPWGEITVVKPIISKPRQRLTNLNKASS